MKKLLVGLVIEGNSTSSTLLRLPAVAEELGPIKASGLQVARRVSNFLRGGFAVSSYADMESARIILIRVPDKSIEKTVQDLCASGLDWPTHTFVLCETWASTRLLAPLKDRGAHVASVVQLPTTQSETFVVEGDVPAVRQLRKFIEKAYAHAIELRPDSKHLLYAATVLCAAIPVPILLMAQQALRDGGVSGNQLSALLEEMTTEMLAGFLKGARAKWGGPLADLLELSQDTYREQLDETHPELSKSLRLLLDWSQVFMARR